VVLKRFSYKRHLSNFTEIRPVTEQIRTDTRKDGRTGGHDEAIGRS